MARRFDQTVLEQIRQSTDIVTLISQYVALKKRGRNYLGLCPFHNEKTPSFTVSPDKGFYHCFGCKASGDAISFLMKYTNRSFQEAVEMLAESAGIELPEEDKSPELMRREARRKRLYEINELARAFYHSCLLKTKLGQEGLAYLKNRGLSEETIHSFSLGFAPKEWNKLYQAFLGRDIAEGDMLAAGLVRKSQDKAYDYFRNRVMFPIRDGRGHVVGFGGRVMDDSEPKYLNSAESDVFNKGKLLFAFDKAYRSIREKKQVILVEGYMDVLQAHNVGITNVVASLGTAFTVEQSQLLLRQADEIILAYDMDGAGRKAAERAIQITHHQEFKVRVVSMPDGKDPDEYIRTHGKDAFLQLVDEAVSPFEFLLNRAMVKYGAANLDGKLAVMGEVFPFIASTAEPVRREGFLRALALPLRLDNSTIFRYFRDFQHKNGKEDNPFSSPIRGKVLEGEGDKKTLLQTESFDPTESSLIAFAMTDTKSLERILLEVPMEDFSHAIHRSMLEKSASLLLSGKEVNFSTLEEIFSKEEIEELARLMMNLNNGYDEEVLTGCIRRVRLKALQKEYKEHSMLADALSRAKDPRFIEELKICQDLQQEMRKWSV